LVVGAFFIRANHLIWAATPTPAYEAEPARVRATLKSRPKSAVREVSSEDGEVDDVDEDLDDDGWESESEDDS